MKTKSNFTISPSDDDDPNQLPLFGADGDHLSSDAAAPNSGAAVVPPNPPPADPAVEPVDRSKEPKTTDSVEQAKQLIASHTALDPTDKEARRQNLLPQLKSLTGFLRQELSTMLAPVIALALLLADGLQFDPADPRNPFKGTRNEFVRAWLRHHGISDSNTRVSRLLAEADLWLAITFAGLPPPPNLSRLEALAAFAVEVAVKLYGDLVTAAGGQVPTYTAIEQAAAAAKPEGKSTAKDLRAELQGYIVATGRQLLGALEATELDRELLRGLVNEMLAAASGIAPKTTSSCKRTYATGPLPYSYITTPDHRLATLVDLGTQPQFTTALQAKASAKRFEQDPTKPGTWTQKIAGNASARHAKVFELEEWVRRLAERTATNSQAA